MALRTPPMQLRSIAGYTLRRTYGLAIPNAAPAAANYVVATWEVGAQYNSYLRRLWVWNPGAATTAQKTTFGLYFTTAASSGGTVATPMSYDPANDSAYTGVARIGNPTVTLAANPVFQFSFYTPALVGAFIPPLVLDFTNEISKAMILRSQLYNPVATDPANINVGMALVNITGGTGYANLDVQIELNEDTR